MSEHTEDGEHEVEPKRAETRQLKNRDDLEAELSETIAKNAKYRQDRQNYQARIRDLEPQAQRGVELEAELAKTKAHYRSEVAFAKLEAMAIKEGILDGDALRLIDPAKLSFDDDGKASNLADVLSEFKSAKPHFFREVAAPNQSTSSLEVAPAVRSPAVNVKEMSPKDFKKAWDAL